MRVAVVTDEIDNDLKKALKYVVKWNIPHIELRTLWGKRVPDLGEEEKRRMINLINDSGRDVVAISPGLFKCSLADFEGHFTQRLPASFELAEKLGTNIVICFGFTTGKDDVLRVIDYLGKAALKAEKAGITLAIEPEPESAVDKAVNTHKIVKAVNNPHLRVNWDPCTSFFLEEEPYPLGYGFVKNYVVHVHLKDAVKDSKTGKFQFTALGQGQIAYKEQFIALKKDGYEGAVSIETHFQPLIENTEESWRRLKELFIQIGETIE